MRVDNDIIKIVFERDYVILMLFPFAFEILKTNSSISISIQIISLNISLTFLMDGQFFKV
mgnify:CR=1 FL=1